jgi:hypothetical protein
MSISTPIISNSENVYSLIKEGKTLDTKIPYSHPKKTGGKTLNITLGRIWFNQLLPEDYPLINEAVNKKFMDKIIENLYKRYGIEEAGKTISNLQTEAFKLATISPNSFETDLFIPPSDWVEKKKEFEKIASTLDPMKFKQKAEALTKELVKYMNEQGFRAENIFGAKGDPISDWKPLLVSKGYVMDIEGNLLGPIVSSLNEGYNHTDFYHAGSEARKNFYIRSALTAHPGYLLRKIVSANAGLAIDTSMTDCGSKKTFNLTVTKDLAGLLLQRNYISQTGTIKNIKTVDEIIDKKIKLRSPLYCKAENGICETCYGNLFKTLNTKNIGILAGGAINVVGINVMMGMRHKASETDTKEVDFNEILKNSGFDLKEFNAALVIEKNKIVAKIPCSIIIDIDEYNDVNLIDCGEKFQLPGILTIQYGTPPEVHTITTPYTFMVDCFKPVDTTMDGDIILMNYEPGEIIMKQDYYTESFNERTVSRFFDGYAKYITDPEVLTLTIQKSIKGIDLVHIETIVSNMFRDEEDNTLPARFTDYKNSIIVGQKKLPFIISWLSAMNFENINKAIKTGLLDKKDAKLDPIEKIVLEQYS